jgi:hypothetical protein
MHLSCWRCANALDCQRDRFFCGACAVIQPPVKCVNYFQYLDVREVYTIDEKQLRQQYRQLSATLHPDKYMGKSKVCAPSARPAFERERTG